LWGNYENSIAAVVKNAKSFTHVSLALYNLNYDYASGAPHFGAAQSQRGSDSFDGMTSKLSQRSGTWPASRSPDRSEIEACLVFRSLTFLFALPLVGALAPTARADEPAAEVPRAPGADGDYLVDKLHDRSARGREYWAYCPRSPQSRPIAVLAYERPGDAPRLDDMARHLSSRGFVVWLAGTHGPLPATVVADARALSDDVNDFLNAHRESEACKSLAAVGWVAYGAGAEIVELALRDWEETRAALGEQPQKSSALVLLDPVSLYRRDSIAEQAKLVRARRDAAAGTLVLLSGGRSSWATAFGFPGEVSDSLGPWSGCNPYFATAANCPGPLFPHFALEHTSAWLVWRVAQQGWAEQWTPKYWPPKPSQSAADQPRHQPLHTRGERHVAATIGGYKHSRSAPSAQQGASKLEPVLGLRADWMVLATRNGNWAIGPYFEGLASTGSGDWLFGFGAEGQRAISERTSIAPTLGVYQRLTQNSESQPGLCAGMMFGLGGTEHLQAGLRVDTRIGFHPAGDRAVMVSLQFDAILLFLPFALPLLGFAGGG